MQGVEQPTSQRGIIPRTFEHIFESIATTEHTKFLVNVSYLEVLTIILIRYNIILITDL